MDAPDLMVWGVFYFLTLVRSKKMPSLGFVLSMKVYFLSLTLLFSTNIVVAQTKLKQVKTIKITQLSTPISPRKCSKQRTVTIIDKCFPIYNKAWMAYIEYWVSISNYQLHFKTFGTPIHRSHDGKYIQPIARKF